MNNPEIDRASDNEENDFTLIEKIQDIGSVAKIDYRSTNLYGKGILLSLGAMTAYEWGPGNEALTAIIGGQVVEMSDGLKGVALTAGVTSAFTLGQQLSSSWLTRKSVQQFPSVANKTFSHMNGDDTLKQDFKYKPFKELPLSKKILYPFTVGTSFVVSREAFITGSTEEKELKHLGRKSAAIVAGSVAVLASAIDTADQLIPDGTLAQSVVDFFKTPIPYIAAVAGVLTKDYIESRRHKKTIQNTEQ